MYTKVFAFSCLVAVSLAVPTPDADADADAFGYGYGLLGHAVAPAVAVAPIAYHVPKCAVEETTITHKVCTPKTEQKCEDIVYKTILVKTEEVCKDLVTKHCSDGTVSTTEVEAEAAAEVVAERKRREADPAYALGLGHLGYAAPVVAHHAVVAPIVTVKHQCVETPHKVCHLEPREEVVENSVPHCVLVDATTCEDVETKVPHTVCA